MLDKSKSIREEIVNSANSKYKVYYFNCSNCDTEIKAQDSQLKRHTGKCRRCTQLKEPYYFIFNELRNHRNKEVNFTLTFEEFQKVIAHPYCHYCKSLLIYNKHSRSEEGKILTRAHQLDRKDNTKGYTFDNVVPCCWTCNRLKSNEFSYEEFIMLSPILQQIKINRSSIL